MFWGKGEGRRVKKLIWKADPGPWAQSRLTVSTNIKTEDTSDSGQRIADSSQH
jgi:hypothetical protein